MDQTTIIFISVLITLLITWILKDLMFKCFVEQKGNEGYFMTVFEKNHLIISEGLLKDMSIKQKPIPVDGKNYFFMTQDQIQNACKSIIKSFPEDKPGLIGILYSRSAGCHGDKMKFEIKKPIDTSMFQRPLLSTYKIIPEEFENES